MGRRVRREPEDTTDARWMGGVTFAVTTSRGSLLGTVEFRVGWDEVAVSYDGRRLGAIDRMKLRHWFARPNVPLAVDELTLTAHGRDVHLALDTAAPSFPMPRQFALQLQSVV